MNNCFYSSDGKFYKLQTIENYEENQEELKPFYIKFKLFSDYGDELETNNDFPICKSCIRENGNGWDGNELSLYKLENDGTLSNDEIPYILQNIGTGATNFDNGKEIGFFRGKLYPGTYILKFKQIITRKPEEMGIIIMLDDDKNIKKTNNKVLFYSRSSRNKDGNVNQFDRKVVNIEILNKFDLNNLDGFMKNYVNNYIFTIDNPNIKKETIITTQPITKQPINTTAPGKNDKELVEIKKKLKNIKENENNENNENNKQKITFWPKNRKYNIKVVLFDDFGEEVNPPSNLPYCKDCVRKDGDNWHSNEHSKDSKLDAGNLVSIVQYDNDTTRVDIDDKFINMGDKYFKNKKKISKKIKRYLYPNKYAIKFENIVRFPDEMGIIIYSDDKVVFYSRSSRSMHGGINQQNRKEGENMKSINNIDYFYIGREMPETDDLKIFLKKIKYLNTKI